MQGQYRESLAAVAMYESPESSTKLDSTLSASPGSSDRAGLQLQRRLPESDFHPEGRPA